jgi:hypothetical protein
VGVTVIGFDGLIRDLETLQERADKEFPKVVRHGATNIKRDWRAGWEAIKHAPTSIPHLVRGVGYDEDFRSPQWSAEIGVAETNSQSPLAHLIEFGSVNNPPYPAGKTALDAEEPRFIKAAEDAATALLDES